MPLNTAMPIDLRAEAPAPVASTSGFTPNQKLLLGSGANLEVDSEGGVRLGGGTGGGGGVRARDRGGVTKRETETKETTEETATPLQVPAGGPITSIAAELRELASLRDAGILTQDEFTEQKRRLLPH